HGSRSEAQLRARAAADRFLQAAFVTLIVHRDERCVIVDKPSGVATHRGWADDDDALLQMVRDEVNAYVYPVNRLDRGASGLVLFALDKAAAAAFAGVWPSADKRYLAITPGHPP